MRGRPRVATVLANEILAKYRWPHALDLRERPVDRRRNLINAAEVTSAIMSPEFRPGFTARNAGSP